MVKTIEPQYAADFDLKRIELGAMTSAGFRGDPRRLAFTLARYKFVAKMLKGKNDVAEIGCGDAFGSRIVAQEVRRLWLSDIDPAFVAEATLRGALEFSVRIYEWDIVKENADANFDAIYMLDVFEHLKAVEQIIALTNIAGSLKKDGVVIIGAPSLESQAYASEISKAGHVGCLPMERLRELCGEYFDNVFMFGMNDEVLHTGFDPMCQYLFALCAGVK